MNQDLAFTYENQEDNNPTLHAVDYLMPPTAENDKQNNSSASELDFMDEEENEGKNYV